MLRVLQSTALAEGRLDIVPWERLAKPSSIGKDMHPLSKCSKRGYGYCSRTTRY
ncbi:hypothetical protein M3J09_004803 [Ascochyta lentis]